MRNSTSPDRPQSKNSTRRCAQTPQHQTKLRSETTTAAALPLSLSLDSFCQYDGNAATLFLSPPWRTLVSHVWSWKQGTQQQAYVAVGWSPAPRSQAEKIRVRRRWLRRATRRSLLRLRAREVRDLGRGEHGFRAPRAGCCCARARSI